MWKAKTSSKIRINFYRRQYLLKLLSCTKFPLNNRQSSAKSSKINRQPSKLEKIIVSTVVKAATPFRPSYMTDLSAAK